MQYDTPDSLPKPDAESAMHSIRVATHLHEQIASAGGEISFAEYMHHVLYAGGLGYYAAGATKFGREGDFVTAPEVSPLFGRIIARQCTELLPQTKDRQMLEFGAGSGRLAVDILGALDELAALPTNYLILEVSPDLQNRQRHLLEAELPHLAGKVNWISSAPKNFSGVMIANEVLDALPVERVRRQSSRLMQCSVRSDGDTFAWSERAAPAQLQAAVEAIESDIGMQLADGFTTEVALAADHWIAEIARGLVDGAVLLFDYGVARREYYAADRDDGWLRCHFRHHAHSDPLCLPGIQDITSWVDFSAVAAASVKSDLDILGYTSQAHFLMSGGLAAETEALLDLPTAEQIRISGEIKKLTLPGEMGENFKCMGLSAGEIGVPSAFLHRDRTRTL